MKIFDLLALHDSRKSFYGKAKVLVLDTGIIQLQSYNTIVCETDNNGYFKMLWGGKTQTTTRHIKEFTRQFNCGI